MLGAERGGGRWMDIRERKTKRYRETKTDADTERETQRNRERGGRHTER